MKAENLMDIITDADDRYIQSALESRHQQKTHKPKRLVFRAVAAAAIIMSLAVTAYATDFAGIKSLRSGGYCKIYDSYQKLDTAEKKAGFEIDAKETFENGYTFDTMEVQSTDAYDEHDVKKFTYKEIDIVYTNDAGHRLFLNANLDFEQIPVSDIPAMETRQIGDITAEFRETHHRSLPAEKEGHLTEEEKLWEQQPGNYIGYFSWEGEASERRVLFVSWVKDGISYFIMDSDGVESPDTLFSMAEELILEP